MKKIVATILAMLIMTVSVFAEVPAFMTETLNNYTADYTLSLSFDSSEDIVALLEELEMPEEISYFVDAKSLLQTLLSYESKMNVQADISNDYKIIKIGVTMDYIQGFDINPNLNIGINSKMGIWINADFTSKDNPVMDVIYSNPILNKYLKIDFFEYAGEEKEAFLKVFDKDFLETTSKEYIDIFLKHAKLTKSISKYTVTMDNDGFIACLEELMPYIFEKFGSIYGVDETTYADLDELSALKGIRLLGDEGIVCNLTPKNDKLYKADVKVDISVDISEIYTVLTGGQEWPYNSSGCLDFTVNESVEASKIGTTAVDFPVLTEENTIPMEVFEPQYEEEFEYEEIPEEDYPLYYIYVDCDKIHNIDGEIYIPLRKTLEAAYEHTVTIGYDNGVVTAASEYFPFEKLVVTIGTDKAYADNKEYIIGNVIEEDGTTYVNYKMFCDIFGWEMGWAQYDILEDYYTFAFYRNDY